MRRMFLGMIIIWGISACGFGQTTSADSQTLQAILSEVRALRQDLRVSQNRAQNMQLLLARFQLQEGTVSRASDHLNDARQKLLDHQTHQKALALELKRLEDDIGTAQDPQQQKDLQDRMKHVQSDLEVFGDIVQQQVTAEAQAERQLRDEQDKLNVLESQMDELIRSMTTSPGKP
jgi:hypothetical protein